MSKLLARLFVAAFAIACSVPASADFLSPEIGVRFPDALGGLQLQGAPQRYPEPGLGYSLRYAGPDIRVDVYVYDLGRRAIGNGPDSPALQQHVGETDREIQAFYAQERQPARRIGQGGEVIGAPQRQWGWSVARYDVQQNGRAMRSVMMLTGFRNYFVKVRATFPAAGGKADPLAPFAAQLSALLATAPPIPATPPAAPPK